MGPRRLRYSGELTAYSRFDFLAHVLGQLKGGISQPGPEGSSLDLAHQDVVDQESHTVDYDGPRWLDLADDPHEVGGLLKRRPAGRSTFPVLGESPGHLGIGRDARCYISDIQAKFGGELFGVTTLATSRSARYEDDFALCDAFLFDFVTPASSNVAISQTIFVAASTIGTTRAAPVPSPKRISI